MNSNSSAPQRDNNGEIDLFELAQAIWQEKWVIVGVTVLVTLCALVYASLLPPVYQTNASTIPPRSADVAPLNLGRDQAGLSELDPSGVYDLFTRNLTAEATRRKFFTDHYRPYHVEQGATASRDELMRRMRRDVVVRRPDPAIMEIVINANDPEVAADWNNIFLQLASDAALNDLKSNTLLEIANNRTVLERKIEVLRESATNQRMDRIARLTDALTIAESVGVENPQVAAGRTAAEGELAKMIDGRLAYMRGTRAIRAELELLLARKNEDPYISELRDLQQQINLVSLVNPEPDGAALFTLDNAAEVPNDPIKPRKVLIVAFGIVLGGILGVIAGLIRIVRRRKPALASE